MCRTHHSNSAKIYNLGTIGCADDLDRFLARWRSSVERDEIKGDGTGRSTTLVPDCFRFIRRSGGKCMEDDDGGRCETDRTGEYHRI